MKTWATAILLFLFAVPAGHAADSMQAFPPAGEGIARFIALGGAPYLIRYNNRLPVVVHVPEGVEERYRIWTARAEVKAIEKG